MGTRRSSAVSPACRSRRAARAMAPCQRRVVRWRLPSIRTRPSACSRASGALVSLGAGHMLRLAWSLLRLLRLLLLHVRDDLQRLAPELFVVDTFGVEECARLHGEAAHHAGLGDLFLGGAVQLGALGVEQL